MFKWQGEIERASERAARQKQNNWSLTRSSFSEVALQSGTIRCAIRDNRDGQEERRREKNCHDVTIKRWQLTEDTGDAEYFLKEKNPPLVIIVTDVQCIPGIVF